MPAVEPSEPQLPPFNHTPAPYQGPSKEEVYALRKQYLSPGGVCILEMFVVSTSVCSNRYP